MTAPWATAHVEADLDWGDLDQELVQRLKRSTEVASRAAQRNFDKLAAGAAKSFDRIESAYDKQMSQMERRSARAATTVNKNLDRIDRNVTVDVEIDSDGAARDLKKTTTAMRAQARANPIDVPVRSDHKRSLAGLGAGLLSVGTKAGLVTAAIAGIGGAIGLAGGAIGGLVAAAMPALGALAAGAGVVMLGMDGIKKAAEVAKPAFESLKSAISDTFASALVPGMEKAAGLMTSLTPQLQGIAGSMSGVFDGVMTMLTANTAQLQAGLGGVSSFITSMGPGIASMTGSFAHMMANAAPAMDSLGAAFGGVLSSIGTEFAKLDTGFFESVAGMVSQLGPALGGVVGAIMQLAQGLMPVIGPLLTGLSTGIQAMVPGLTVLGTALAEALTPILPILGQLISSLATALAPALEPIGSLLQVLGQALIAIMPSLGQLITSFAEFAGPILESLMTALAPIIEALSGALIEVFEALKPAIEPIGQMFQTLAPVIAQIATIFGQVLAEAITALMPVVMILAETFAQVLTAVAPILPILGDALIQIIQMLAPIIQDMAVAWSEMIVALLPLLPPLMKIVQAILPPMLSLIGSLLPILTMVAQFFASAIPKIAAVVMWLWNNVITPAWNGIKAAISMAVDIIGGVLETVKGYFQGVSDKVGEVKDWVVEKFTAIVDFVRGLPGKITEAASGMWEGLKGGFKSVVNTLLGWWNSFAQKLSFNVPDIPGVPKRGERIQVLPTVPLLAAGGQVAARRVNGLLRGPGTGTSDSMLGVGADGVPTARVSTGEFVVNARSTRLFLPLLRYLNRMRSLPALAGGGVAGEPYGMPSGTNISYGGAGFPAWVYELGDRFNVKPSTYAGHQEGSGQNRGIDWSGSVSAMQKFAEYLLGIAPDMEQVIWQNPDTGDQIGVADGKRVGPGTDQPGYYSDDWGGHQDHVHTRQSKAIGVGTSGSTKGIDTTGSTGSLGSSSGGGSTPIGSGIGAGSSGSSGSASWGNSGGGSKANTAADAKRGGLTPVWVENWPASIGGGGSSSSLSTGSDSGGTLATGGTTPSSTDLKKGATKEQMVAEVVRIGREKNMSDEDIESAVATMLAESDGKNYANSNVAGSTDRPHDAVGSDHKSVGVMQQQVGMGWGELDELMDPTYAIGKYYERLGEVEGRDQMSVAQRAQAVQRSGFADGSNYAAKQSEARDLIAKAGQVPVTPSGNVPVEVTNPGDTGGDLAVAQDPPAAPGAPDGTSGGAASQSMPYGQARANAWLGEQDLGGQLQGLGMDAGKEILGEWGDLIGVKPFVERGIDEMVTYLRQIAEKDPVTEVKMADVVNINGGNPAETEKATTKGMTAVMDTYRGEA